MSERPLYLPVVAVAWACHAKTTIRDAFGEVLADCSGHGRDSAEDEAIAAEIVRRVNAQPGGTSLAWDGHCVSGDRESIAAVQAALNAAGAAK